MSSGGSTSTAKAAGYVDEFAWMEPGYKANVR
jgi:hypothetical protein